MKIRVRWTYTYFTEHTFEEVVDVPDALDGEDLSVEDARECAREAALAIPNGDLTPVKTEYPGDPVEDIEVIVAVATDTPATIRWTGDDTDPELLITAAPNAAETGASR